MAYVKLENLSVEFPIYNSKARSIRNKILSSVGGKFGQNKDIVVVKALSNITFKAAEGDRIALIGHNGAGKTTLLRVLSGIYEPTNGTIETNGKISSLTDLGLGMDSEATGYENILLRGIIMGMDFDEIKQKAFEIIEFSELIDYINMPIRTYSSGMYLRLAFAISTSIHPEILILDEVIGVGDKNFIDKAQSRISSLIDKSKIMFLSCHDPLLLKKFCNKGIYLEHGELKDFSDIDHILKLL